MINRDPSRYCGYCGVFNGFAHSAQCVHHVTPDPGMVTTRTDVIITPVPPEVQNYRGEIARFVEAMVYKLGVHSKKGKWEGQTIESRIPKLKDEVVELEEAIKRGNMVEVLLEAADVANYALIISAKALEK